MNRNSRTVQRVGRNSIVHTKACKTTTPAWKISERSGSKGWMKFLMRNDPNPTRAMSPATRSRCRSNRVTS